jgi:hypothetical protein
MPVKPVRDEMPGVQAVAAAAVPAAVGAVRATGMGGNIPSAVPM